MVGFLLRSMAMGAVSANCWESSCSCRACDRAFVMVVGSITSAMEIIVAIRRVFCRNFKGVQCPFKGRFKGCINGTMPFY